MSEWRRRWGYEIATKPSAPGIFRLKSGGYLVSVRARDRRQGGRRSSTEVMHHASLPEAKRRAEELRAGVRSLARGVSRQQKRWSAFAASLFERKVAANELKSAKSIERWDTTLRLHLIPAFGDFWCHELRYADIVEWRAKVAARFDLPKRIPHPDAERAKAGALIRNPEHTSPTTANGWLSILRLVCKQMSAELELERDPAAAVRDFDTSEHPAYTEERPNALTPDQAQKFLAHIQENYPQHYAMTLLGFVTGLRPSSLRPLRRKGDEPDVLWTEGAILVRRSNSLGQEVMNTTKTKRRQRIALPAEVMAALKEHVESFDDGPREESALLFPARHGGMLTRSVLDKPFAATGRAIGLPFRLTPRGMRRTNKDLMRAAQVPDVVAKAISGHTTDAMHERYSTAASQEVREAIEQAARMVGGTKRAGKRAGKGEG